MSAWCYVSGDRACGKNQKSISLWNQVYNIYHENRQENPREISERNVESMKGRWKRLTENANKWIAAYKEAYRRKISGMSQNDIEKEAPSWAAFVKSITSSQLQKHKLFAQHQEAVRKDVERAFGVLQARFAFLRHPCLVWDTSLMGKIMMTCIIMHNMIVDDE
ncbi:hypothetical protein ACS0TY_032322 [Phlomoides rotata]